MKLMRIHFIVFIITSLACVTFQTVRADEPQPPRSIQNVIDDITKEKFKFSEQGLIYGYMSIKSCLYKRSGMMILEHYCYPRGNYPARSFSVISQDLSLIQFYEEKMDGRINRVVRINIFPEDWKSVYSGPVEDLDISSINRILEYFDKNRKGGCWSQNRDEYKVGCYLKNEAPLKDWFQETQALVESQDSWNLNYNKVTSSLER